ncbi:hypothetical protein BN137_940 [Cronobacter condimenti 1330]|uniref:Uncharacterized protein n=1 Tax=Cronobacter condimenti 1330 TaxID=1073999 RepID=K7ZZC4_9ENTR|nr:hypothetical protein BN137_940 [Cronobacter condimenti 1330]
MLLNKEIVGFSASLWLKILNIPPGLKLPSTINNTFSK